MKVLFVCNFESPYRIDFWNELTQYCDVTVLFTESIAQQKERNKKWFSNCQYKFKFERLNQIGIKNKFHFCPKVFKYLKDDYDIIIFHPYSPPTCALGILYCIVHKIPYVINSDGGFAKTGKGLLEHYKKLLISNASEFLSTSDETDEYLAFYGGEKSHMHRYTLSTLHNTEILAQLINLADKSSLRDKLGICEKKVVISVGNMIPRKGFDLLLKAARNINDEIGLYIVGGKVPKNYIEYCEKNQLSNIYFLDFMQKDLLRQYYLASDVFVLPTREDIWGLVVIEALANGLPVITTNRCIAGKTLITDGYNGFIYEVDDTDELANVLNVYFGDMTNAERMSSNALKSVNNCSIETMAKRHATIFAEILAAKKSL